MTFVQFELDQINSQTFLEIEQLFYTDINRLSAR